MNGILFKLSQYYFFLILPFLIACFLTDDTTSRNHSDWTKWTKTIGNVVCLESFLCLSICYYYHFLFSSDHLVGDPGVLCFNVLPKMSASAVLKSPACRNGSWCKQFGFGVDFGKLCEINQRFLHTRRSRLAEHDFPKWTFAKHCPRSNPSFSGV